MIEARNARRGARRRWRALASAAIGAVALAAIPGAARANGRSPNSTAVHFVPEEARTILMPVTFGLMLSRDDGQTFHWVCEAAMGYAGTFDPQYAVLPDSTILLSTQSDNPIAGGPATTGDLRRSRDGGCTFETVAAGVFGEFPTITEVELGPDGRLWVGTASGEPNDFWVSDDQGETFVSANLAEEKVWWYTLRTTAADSERIYVTGFRPVDRETGTPAVAILRRSDDGGQTWSDLPVDGFVFGDEQTLYLLGVSPVDPEVVFARTVNSVGGNSDIIYRSADGGVSWTEMARYETLPLNAFWISPDGQRVIAGAPFPCPGDPPGDAGGAAPNGCVRISEDGGVTWRRANQEPRLNCIGERSDGTLFGCTDRSIDGHSLARSTDGGDTWEPVYRFRDTVGPLECPAGTAQAECAATTFPAICQGTGMCSAPDAGPGDDGDESSDGGGCCKVGGRAAIDAGWLPLLALTLLLLRRRR